jgi:formate dehydrogenase iron-sulfur subunit
VTRQDATSAKVAKMAERNTDRAGPNPQSAIRNPHSTGARPGAVGFLTDTTLCIGCKACEVACKQWNQLPADDFGWTGFSYDNTVDLGATTWRHVAFVERLDDGAGRRPTSLQPFQSNWLMLSDVCKHCESAPCQHSCPTGAILYNQFGDVYVQNDICNGCGYCVTACPFGVLDRADRLATNVSENGDGDPDGPRGDGRAHKCTLCMDRQVDGLTPACAKACPTASIQFGPIEDLRATARRRVDELRNRGNGRAYLYGCDSVGDYGPLNAFFLLEDHPNEYNLPEAPPQPFRGQGRRYAASLAAGVALTLFSALVFGKSGKRK